MTEVKTDPEQIRAFTDALFRYASEGTFVSLRAFDDKERGKSAFEVQAVQINGSGLAPVIDSAAKMADRCANAAQSIVFCPPVVTFKDAHNAKAENVAEGVALSVDCDQAPYAAREKLESLLGPATVVAASGGEWADPATGELQDKLHLHWRINEPTQTVEEHGTLKAARELANKLVGGDDTNAPLVHPIRWPGSVHRKGEPRLAHIESLNEDAEIDLGEALEALQDAAGALPLSERAKAISEPHSAPHSMQIDTGHQGKTADDYAHLICGMRTDGQKHKSVRDIAASMAGQGCSQKFVEGFIKTICPVYDQNVQNLIDSAFKKYVPSQSSTIIKPTAPFQFTCVSDLKYRAPEYIIGDLFETDTLGLIFGDPGCGKSFLAVDVALSVATGIHFHGRDTKQGSVFFIAGEGHNGLARRFAAWSQVRGVPLADAPLFKSERAAQFLDEASAKAVADAVGDLATQHGSPALIIIDTLARNFGAGDENNTKDMSEFVVAVDDLKAQFPGCSVLIVHHSGHAEKQRARGAMALKGALDCEYRVEKDGHNMRLINTKMKDAEPPQDVYFSFKQVELDAQAKSAVLEAISPPERQVRLTPAQRLAQDTYVSAAAKAGVWEDGVFVGVNLEDWRAAFYEKHTGDSTATKRQAFNRARADLASAEIIAVQNDRYLWRDGGVQMAVMLQRDKRDEALQNEECHAAEAVNTVTGVTNA